MHQRGALCFSRIATNGLKSRIRPAVANKHKQSKFLQCPYTHPDQPRNCEGTEQLRFRQYDASIPFNEPKPKGACRNCMCQREYGDI